MKVRIEELASNLWEMDEQIAEDLADYIYSLRDGDEKVVSCSSEICKTICGALRKYFSMREK